MSSNAGVMYRFLMTLPLLVFLNPTPYEIIRTPETLIPQMPRLAQAWSPSCGSRTWRRLGAQTVNNIGCRTFLRRYKAWGSKLLITLDLRGKLKVHGVDRNMTWDRLA